MGGRTRQAVIVVRQADDNALAVAKFLDVFKAPVLDQGLLESLSHLDSIALLHLSSKVETLTRITQLVPSKQKLDKN